MKPATEPLDPLLSWKPLLDAMTGSRRERLKELLREHLSCPLTVQQQMAQWEKVLSADGARIPAEQRIVTLEAALEEAITVLKGLVRG